MYQGLEKMLTICLQHHQGCSETPKCAYIIYGQPLIQPLAWIVFTSNISIVCILKKKYAPTFVQTSWRISLKPCEIIWPPAFNNFTEIGTIHSQSLLYIERKYINIFREIYFTPSLTAFQVQCSRMCGFVWILHFPPLNAEQQKKITCVLLKGTSVR